MSRANRKRSAGHIDNRSTLWIVLILAAVAVPNFIEYATGKDVIELFRSLPYPWPAFLLTLAGVLVLGLIVPVAGALLWRGAPFHVARESDRVCLREREPTQVVGGMVVAVLALTLLAYGILGSGWLWGLVAVAGLFLLLVAGALLSHRVTWEFAPDTITRHERQFGVPRTRAWPLPDRPEFVADEHASGGAFGQPLVTHHRVCLGDAALYESGEAERAAAFLAALREAYPDASGNV